MRPNLDIIYSLLRFLNLSSNKGKVVVQIYSEQWHSKKLNPVSIYSAHLTVICANRGTPRKRTRKTIWLRFAPLAIEAKVAVKGFGLNRKDKCIKGNAVTWKRKRAVMPPPLFLFAVPPRAFWRLQHAAISFIKQKICLLFDSSTTKM